VPFSQPWQGPPGGEAAAARRDWFALLAGSGLRRGVTGRTLAGVYTGCVPEVEALAVRRPGRGARGEGQQQDGGGRSACPARGADGGAARVSRAQAAGVAAELAAQSALQAVDAQA
jgi:hypothetical protein